MLFTHLLTLCGCCTWMEGVQQSEQYPQGRVRLTADGGSQHLSHRMFSPPAILPNNCFWPIYFLEWLLLITVSLSCNEIQVFKDGLEKYSQLMKVDLTPEWVFFSSYLLKARCCYKKNSHEELCLRLKMNGVSFLYLDKKSNCFSIKQN